MIGTNSHQRAFIPFERRSGARPSFRNNPSDLKGLKRVETIRKHTLEGLLQPTKIHEDRPAASPHFILRG